MLSVALAQRDSNRSRTAILDAAETVFARNGYEATSFSEICKGAGVSRGLPSYLFGNKGSLYRAVVERAADRLRTSTIEPLRRKRSLPIDAALEAFVSTYVDYLSKNPKIVRLLQWEMLSTDKNRPFAPTSQLMAELLDAFKSILKRAGRTTVDAEDLLGSAVALCFFPFMFRVDGLGIGSADPRVIQQHKLRITRLILAAAGTPRIARR